MSYTEKRMVGNYEVISSINIGRKEVFFAIDKNNTEGEKYLCGFIERNDLFERYYECVSSNDYIEIAKIYGDRISNEAELFKEEVSKLDIPLDVITEDECTPIKGSDNIQNKIIVINPDVLKPEYQRIDRQLYLALSGFGTYGNSRGNAVFCVNLHTGKHTRFERYDILGTMTKEQLPDWAKKGLKEHYRKEKEKNKEAR